MVLRVLSLVASLADVAAAFVLGLPWFLVKTARHNYSSHFGH